MKYNCIVVDDNIIERNAVLMHLEKIQTLSIIAGCENVQQAVQMIHEHTIDIVYSDVHMPCMNEFRLNKNLINPPALIVITSLKDFADSVNIKAIDFVMKPVTFDDLLTATNKAIEYILLTESSRKKDIKVPITAEILHTPIINAKNYFFIKETGGFTKLNYSDVLYVESMGDFSKIHTVQGNKHVILVNLKHCESQLPGDVFRRVHKQYVVNLWHIVTITASEIILSSGEEISVSNVYRHQLIDTIVSERLLHRS